MSKPILGITMGDPFGNGPEITVRALSDKTVYDRCRPLVVGDTSSMKYALKVAKKVSGIDLALNPVKDVKDAKFTYGTIDGRGGAQALWCRSLRPGRRGILPVCEEGH